MSGRLHRLLDRGIATEDDEVGKRNLLAAGRRGIELLLDRFECLQNLSDSLGLIDFPVPLWRQANARNVALLRLSEPRNVEADAQRLRRAEKPTSRTRGYSSSERQRPAR